MKPLVFLRCLGCAAIIVASAIGCNRQDSAEAESGDQSPAPAASHGFKAGRGVFLTVETEAVLGVQTAEPVEMILPQRTEAVAQVYATGKATALVDSNTAFALVPGSMVALGPVTKPLSTGTLVRFERQFEQAMGQVEALIEFEPVGSLAAGISIPATFSARETKAELAVPEASLLQTGEGGFVFVANGGHFLRTRVMLGARTDGWVQITDGLLAGDVIVTNGVQGLWCIELQATKGGAACCPAPLPK